MVGQATAGSPCRWGAAYVSPALLVLILLLGLHAAPAAAQSCAKPTARVVSAQGTVQVLRAGQKQWQSVAVNADICHGETVRVLENGRAALALSNDVIVRVDHRSAVTFAGPEQQSPSLLELCRGALHFITRFPRPLRVITPFMNASVEGTEFSIAHGDVQDALAVMEGRVSAVNSAERDLPKMCEELPDAARTAGGGRALLAAGQIATVVPGKAPVPTLLSRPADAVQWALYYPPVVDYQVAAGAAAWQSAWAKSSFEYNEHRLAEALETAAKAGDAATDARFYVWRAGLLLQVGRAEEAERDLQQALRLRGADADAYALQAIVAVVRNEKDRALKLARDAVQLQSTSPAAHIAMSYALQAQFKIEEALASAREAAKNDPTSGIAWARVAELEMSAGNLKTALEAAQRAVAASPKLSRTQTIFGFAHLTRTDTAKAKDAFAAAIALDSADPLPRLGNGLALIREGKVALGRKEIEIAASLDPGNSLVRSYLGKAYFEERRDKLAQTEFDLAKALDPRDPTPWFYDAIMLQGQQRPAAAVQAFEKAVELNDNRAVSRSRLLLDKDLGSRSVSLGRAYSEVGLEPLAVREATASLARDPADYSAHRLLSDLYQNRERHEFARGSELLQAQLMQPVNPTPVQPRNAFGNLALIPAAAAFQPSLYEQTSLFDRDRIQMLLSGQTGNLHTDSYEGILTAVKGPLMFSAGHFHYDTRGFRPNNDLKHNISTAFVQFDVTRNLSVQADYRKRETVSGDLLLNFDPSLSLPLRRTTIDHKAFRVGATATLTDESKLLLSVIDGERRTSESLPDPTFINIDGATVSDARQYEAAYAYSGSRVRLFTGARVQRISTSVRTVLDFTPLFGVPCFPFLECDTTVPRKDKEKSAYAYATFAPLNYVDVTLGVARYELELGDFKWTRWSPKLGLRVRPAPGTSIGLGAMEAIKPYQAVNETIEPTNVMGINQFFDDQNLAKTRRVGATVDHRVSRQLYVGAAGSGRSVQTPGFNFDNTFARFNEADERMHEGYVAWLPTANTNFKLGAQYEGFRKPAEELTPNDVVRVATWIVPVTLQQSFSGMFFTRVALVNVWQEVERSPPVVSAAGKDSFSLVDLGVGVRLPQRRGFVRLDVRNLLDQKFQFHDVNFFSAEPKNPRFVPTRVILLSIAVTL